MKSSRLHDGNAPSLATPGANLAGALVGKIENACARLLNETEGYANCYE